MDDKFLDTVKELADAVLGFLHEDSGNDDYHIENMGLTVRSVLVEARRIPALRAWAEQAASDDDKV